MLKNLRSNTIKSLCIMIFAFTMITVCSKPMNVSADSYKQSGRSGIAKLSFEQLAGLYDSIESYNNLYATPAVVKSGSYAPATMSAEATKTALQYINYYRIVAGVRNISFTNDLNLSSSYGALVCAANGVISHTPAKPAGMSDSLYNNGYFAAGSSNLSSATGYAESDSIALSINGQMEDSRGNNVSTLGHRRWLISPNLSTMGIGSANVGSSYYTAVRVAGSGVTSNTNIKDYDFISWPASGNNLSDSFDVSCPWSITLNPYLYSTPARKDVKVTLTRVSDGKKWNFNSASSTSTTSTIDFFNVNTNNYSIGNCIIFRPAYRSLSAYKGDYIVEVSGIKTKAGSATTLAYKVSFAARKTIESADSSVASMLTQKPAAESTPSQTSTVLSSNTSYATTVKTTTSGSTTLKTSTTTKATTTVKTTTEKTTTATTAAKKVTTKVVSKPTVKAPSKVVLSKIKVNGKKKATATWKKQSDIKGYQLQYCKFVSFKTAKSVKLSKNKVSYQMKGLKSKKKYYVRVRSYKVVSGKTYYGKWSNLKSFKAK